MGRWQPDARGRLEQAALQLYTERGFDETTVADIAARAGLTERTYFRYFADKREVLFGGQEILAKAMTAAINEAPADATPLDMVAGALRSTGAMFNPLREHSRRRHAVIAANTALQERELIKLESLAALMADALQGRGVDQATAQLAAETGTALFKIAWERWIGDAGDIGVTGFEDLVDQTLHRLRGLATEQ
jgi:AcrR family transcriptional regulator